MSDPHRHSKPPLPHECDEELLSHLLDLCQHLTLGIITPDQFSANISNHHNVRLNFPLYLPLLLQVNTFSLSPVLGEALHIINDPTLVQHIKFSHPTLATTSLMLTIPASFLPSDLLRRIRTNALVLQHASQWTHVKITTAVHNTLQNCVLLPENNAVLPRKSCPLPNADILQFQAWFQNLSRFNSSPVEKLVQHVNQFDDPFSIVFLSFAYDDSRTSANAFKHAISQIAIKARLVADLQTNPKQFHSFLVQLVDLISTTGTDPLGNLNWKTIAIAFAVLYQSSDQISSRNAWWRSILVALTYLQASETAPHAHFMFLLPFASADCPPLDIINHFFFLISANDDLSSIYTILRFIRAMDKRLLEDDQCLSFISSCLPLPEPIFNQTINLVHRWSP